MRVELPVLTRCCMCFPLRYGLIVWGYIRLAAGLFLLTGVTTGFMEMLHSSKPDEYRNMYLVLIGAIVVLVFNDVVLNALFIFGGHKKNLRLLRAYYIYNIVLWVLMIMIDILFIAQSVRLLDQIEQDLIYVWIILMDIIIYFGHIVIQLYVILLLRSEIVKLTNNCEFRFVNNAAQLEIKYEILDAKDSLYGNGNVNLEDTCKIKHENDSEQ